MLDNSLNYGNDEISVSRMNAGAASVIETSSYIQNDGSTPASSSGT